MELETVLKALLAGFERERIRYAVMGGFALALLQAPRDTGDLDFLVPRDDLDRLERLMASLGFERRYASENVSQYRGKDSAWGFVDFFHAFRPISLRMLERAQLRPAFGGSLSVRVLEPEDVIGLKVQGMANNPDRYNKDVADIEALMAAHGTKLDWKRLEEYFSLFRLDQVFARLRARFSGSENA